MEILTTFFNAIDYRDPLWIAIAYACGFLAWQIRLPPLVGFLLAGFVLNFSGVTGGEFLDDMAALGVTLLLFTIGLKLRVRELLRPEIWAVTTLHMLLISFGTALLLSSLIAFGLPLISDLDFTSALILGFAFSFSSTVFAVKVFEEKGGMNARHGRIAIGVLIVQDIAAVVFLALSTAKLPSPWAIAMIAGLLLAKPFLIMLLRRAGHGELLILYGLALALGGYTLFEAFGLKGDLGALFLGVLLAQYDKAKELAKSLLSLKDLFLVGFFLSIGMAASLSLETFFIALSLLLLIPLKMFLFHILFSRFRLRLRTASFASLALGNFSEFGLIVITIAVSYQWLGAEWLAVMALVVVLSFILAAPLNSYAESISQRLTPWLKRLEHVKRLPEDAALNMASARVLVCGMGRIGSRAYEQLQTQYAKTDLLGLDFDEDKVKLHQEKGDQVFTGDTSNPDFWQRIEKEAHQLELILLCMPNHEANLQTTKAARAWGFSGHIATVIKYPEEAKRLRDAGVDEVFNVYAEVGSGFAQDTLQNLATHKHKGV